jgi:2-keto-3-deoxy-6-phosphogluconate aldolase
VTGPSTPLSSAESPGRPPLPPGLAACPVIAILRRVPPPAVLPLARALLAAGVRVAELTVDSPDALSLISALRDQLPELTVGAGTVLHAESARRAVSAGAEFLVSPHTDPELLDVARGRGVPFFPGAANAADFIAHGCVAVGVGSWLVAGGDPAEATRRAGLLVRSLRPAGP